MRLLLILAAALPLRAQDNATPSVPPISAPAASMSGGSVKLIAYDAGGKVLDINGLYDFLGRVDRGSPADPARISLWASAPEGNGWVKPKASQMGALLMVGWDRLPRARLSLVWPISESGFANVWADKGGAGFTDGDVVYLNEEIALTQYRLFKEAWLKHLKDMVPAYEPGAKAKKLAGKAQSLMADAQASRGGARRAGAFDKALRATEIAWEKMVCESGLQIAHDEKYRPSLRFGLTLDESLLSRLDHFRWIVDMVKRSGANWVRLVFRPNPSDFAYAKEGSFNEYDGVVKELRAANIRVMGCLLATTQWPVTLTPEAYAERARNLVLHYRGQINSWEVGNEINGDWLGGAKTPMETDKVFAIYSAAAAEVKKVEPSLETVATLYWWDATAPDEEHSLFGWLAKYVPRGFGRNL
jgi:hypothetical protein